MFILCNHKFSPFLVCKNSKLPRYSNFSRFFSCTYFKHLGNPVFFKPLQQSRKFTKIFPVKVNNITKKNQIQWKDLMYLKSYFHDGSITGFEQSCNKISILMESAVISNLDFMGPFELSKNRTLKGKLCLENSLDIRLDGHPILEKLQMLADSASILDFEMKANRVEFFIEWTNYPPKEEVIIYSDIKIKAMKIYWENDPKN